MSHSAYLWAGSLIQCHHWITRRVMMGEESVLWTVLPLSLKEGRTW